MVNFVDRVSKYNTNGTLFQYSVNGDNWNHNFTKHSFKNDSKWVCSDKIILSTLFYWMNIIALMFTRTHYYIMYGEKQNIFVPT